MLGTAKKARIIKKIIKPFVQWGRRADKNGRYMNPVILLTNHELFVDHLIGAD